jgi:hypothetical protein
MRSAIGPRLALWEGVRNGKAPEERPSMGVGLSRSSITWGISISEVMIWSTNSRGNSLKQLLSCAARTGTAEWGAISSLEWMLRPGLGNGSRMILTSATHKSNFLLSSLLRQKFCHARPRCNKQKPNRSIRA